MGLWGSTEGLASVVGPHLKTNPVRSVWKGCMGLADSNLGGPHGPSQGLLASNPWCPSRFVPVDVNSLEWTFGLWPRTRSGRWVGSCRCWSAARGGANVLGNPRIFPHENSRKDFWNNGSRCQIPQPQGENLTRVEPTGNFLSSIRRMAFWCLVLRRPAFV